ncbi:MAG: type IV toxin-antitoxin system AbiEi family antitoxin [Propionibacteriaceae bacterium]|nr:type IV toxin-antitoxin system AbiEi family antitoxin [Propionibacteriaceae bacterium]
MRNVNVYGVKQGAVRAPQAADWAISQGISSMTTSEVAVLLDVPEDQVRRRLAVPKARGEWIAPARGLWMPVQPQYRGAGGPPGIEFVDGLARFLGVDYYVGWLTAAAHHGAAHHAPMVFQVAVSKVVADRKVGGVRMLFLRRDRVGRVPTVMSRTYSGDVPFSTPAVTALDVAADLDMAAGIDNAANVVIDLVGEAGLTAKQVADVAQWYPIAPVRRVGWIMDTFSEAKALEPLVRYVQASGVPPSLLHPEHGNRGRIDSVWQLRLNTEVDPDT